jgi:hypothetical protein
LIADSIGWSQTSDWKSRTRAAQSQERKKERNSAQQRMMVAEIFKFIHLYWYHVKHKRNIITFARYTKHKGASRAIYKFEYIKNDLNARYTYNISRSRRYRNPPSYSSDSLVTTKAVSDSGLVIRGGLWYDYTRTGDAIHVIY